MWGRTVRQSTMLLRPSPIRIIEPSTASDPIPHIVPLVCWIWVTMTKSHGVPSILFYSTNDCFLRLSCREVKLLGIVHDMYSKCWNAWVVKCPSVVKCVKVCNNEENEHICHLTTCPFVCILIRNCFSPNLFIDLPCHLVNLQTPPKTPPKFAISLLLECA